MTDREDTDEHRLDLDATIRHIEAEGIDMSTTRRLLEALRNAPEVDTPARGLPAVAREAPTELVPVVGDEMPTELVPIIGLIPAPDAYPPDPPLHQGWTDPAEGPLIIRDERTRAARSRPEIQREKRAERHEREVVESLARLGRLVAWALALGVGSWIALAVLYASLFSKGYLR